MKSNDDFDQIRIRGLIVPSAWDDKGSVTSISISTFNEDEFLVKKDSITKKLLPYIREGIEVSGFVREENGVKIIEIKSYQIKISSLFP